ncbi:MAG: hypothetical protein HFE44_02360 [Oscillospiraceae bacterium]|jgi:carbohydrate diacid regulator|nr:hypothetical protein [Oscillospiraceae bacterium]
MPLSKTVAEQIISDLDAVIPSRINLIDTNGVIIASSDPKRIGCMHAGAKYLMDQQLEELIVHFDGEYSGALQGVNYPLVFQNKIVGILGITGEYNHVKDSACAIKRITELLLDAAYRSTQRRLGEAVRNRFLTEWLEAQPQEIDEVFISEGLTLHIDITLPRRVFVVRTGQDDRDQRTEQAEEYIRQFLTKLDHSSLSLKYGGNLVCMVSGRSDEKMRAAAWELAGQLLNRFGLKAVIGIDQPSDYRAIGQSYRKALSALNACAAGPEEPVRTYDSLSVELFTGELSASAKRGYISRIMGSISGEELAEAVRLLDVFYGCEGSLAMASQKLFIHRNTLQYRLRRIAEHTGYDPRSIRCAGLFQMVSVFYKELQGLPSKK